MNSPYWKITEYYKLLFFTYKRTFVVNAKNGYKAKKPLIGKKYKIKIESCYKGIC